MSIFIQPIFSCWISNIQRTRICAMMLSANKRRNSIMLSWKATSMLGTCMSV